MGELLSEIMGQQTLATVKEKRLTDEEKAHKQAILAQYAQISDGEAYPFWVYCCNTKYRKEIVGVFLTSIIETWWISLST